MPALRLLDVRPILAKGVDPLEDILRALAPLPPGGVLGVVAPFHPRPLEGLLSGQGHSVAVEALEGGAHLLTAVISGAPALEDLRGLEPPEPLVRVLEASAVLAPGQAYLARTPRAPRLLAARLDERGQPWEMLELPDGSALVRVEARR